MAEEAPAPAAAPAKSPKKNSSKPAKAGPSVRDLIVGIVADSKEKKGVSLAAVKKGLIAKGYDVEKNKNRVKTNVRALVAKGTLVQQKGTGASGSFKLSKQVDVKAKTPVKKAAPKVQKPAAKKPTAAKKPKPAAKKAVAAKKSPKKSPKKAAKKAAAPKKVAKSPAKSPKKKVVKKAAAPKKSPAKKVAKPKAAAKKTAAKKK